MVAWGTVNPRDVQSVLRSRGMCGNVSADKTRVCVLSPRHPPVRYAEGSEVEPWCCDGIPVDEIARDVGSESTSMPALVPQAGQPVPVPEETSWLHDPSSRTHCKVCGEEFDLVGVEGHELNAFEPDDLDFQDADSGNVCVICGRNS